MSPSSSSVKLATCKAPIAANAECMPSKCGANSSVVNPFPIAGVRANGDCNEDGAQLVPGSMKVGACEGATLDLDGDKLVGRRTRGDVACQGEALKDTTFTVRSYAGKDATIKIADVVAYTAPNGETRTAYRMENATGQGLCDPAASKAMRAELGLPELGSLNDIGAPTHELVIPVRSELYQATSGSAVPVRAGWNLQSKEWLQLACVDDALAKRSLLEMNTDNVARSRAALRMLTADYCGGAPMTVRGTRVAWESGTGMMREARWSENGAVCLSEPRILHQGGGEAKIPTNVPARVAMGCENCSVEEFAAKARDCSQIAGAAMKGTLPTCEAGEPASQVAFALDSYVPTDIQ